MGELSCKLAQRKSLLYFSILRFHNVYEPHCVMDTEKSQNIPSLIRKAINIPNEDFIVCGSGNQCSIEAIVIALEAVAEKGMNKVAIQISSDFSTSIKEIAEG